jgi:hypothetical protein
MGIMADYVVISDPAITLTKGGDIDEELAFNIPNNARPGETSILTFRMETLQGASALQVKVEINGIQEWTYPVPLSGRHCFTVHEVLDANQLKVGANVVKFTLIGTAGSMKVSDVYVLFRETN